MTERASANAEGQSSGSNPAQLQRDWNKAAPSAPVSPSPNRDDLVKALKALRELASGYFHDGVGGKFPLTEMGKVRREMIIRAALERSDDKDGR